jgi:predicted amidophosphoribosyltransferase
MDSGDNESDSSRFDDLGVKLVRRSVKGRVKLCPRCLSKLDRIGELSGWLVPDDYFCEHCGYHGHVAFEISPEQVPQESTK